VSRGVRAVTGREMPVFPKRRLQQGLTAGAAGDGLFPHDAAIYRRIHQEYWEDRARSTRG
jgi:asparagine synthase (glutamine-hydrolysing)